MLNTAISGSQTADLIPQLDDLVVRHNPRVLCYYCGSNDINNAIPPDRIIENTRQTFLTLRERIPDLSFLYLSIIKAPQKQDRWDVVDEVHRGIDVLASTCPSFERIDINPVFFTPDGQPRMAFYLEDQLHLTPSAYAALGAWLFPLIEERLQ